ncbi:glycosyltransferase [Phreatobacter sp.]|uniref:glycosyltransferase n=1 Tax=Phreatobacter sp. TaxID=1966341 RepID=UPI003F70861D
MPKVSVVMAACNGASHIAGQLESIRRQTLKPYDLWVSDDGSSDETLRIVSAFAETAPFPVRIWVNTESGGLCESILSLALLCEGQFIALCSQDGEWHPEKLEQCVAMLQDQDALLCTHTTTLLDSRSRYAGYLPQGIAARQSFAPLSLSPWGEFVGPSLVFRREMLSWLDFRDRGPDPFVAGARLRHDRWIYFLAHGLGHVVTLPRPLMGHRQSMATPRGLLARMTMARSIPTHSGVIAGLELRQEAAKHRADLMASLGRQGRRGPLAHRARAAADYWQRLQDVCALRMSLYLAPSFAERRAAFNRLLALGVYTKATGQGLRGGTLALDALLGLMKVSDAAAAGTPKPGSTIAMHRDRAGRRLRDHA